MNKKVTYVCICLILVLDFILFACCGALAIIVEQKTLNENTCSTCKMLSEVVDSAKQPSVEEDLLCYDYTRGLVYKCFVRDDGNIQLRINEEGNLIIAKTIETAESRIIRNEEKTE